MQLFKVWTASSKIYAPLHEKLTSVHICFLRHSRFASLFQIIFMKYWIAFSRTFRLPKMSSNLMLFSTSILSRRTKHTKKEWFSSSQESFSEGVVGFNETPNFSLSRKLWSKSKQDCVLRKLNLKVVS